MYLNIIQQEKLKKEFSNKYGNCNKQKNNNCYNCSKPSYFARDCKIKNKVVQHLNVLRVVLIKKEDSEDWDKISAEEEELTYGQFLIDIIQRIQQFGGIQNNYKN
jgi:hypothetical protein